MWRSTVVLRRAAAATTAASPSDAAPLASFSSRVEAFCRQMQSGGAVFDCVAVRPSEGDCRGLVAKCPVREGTTVLSVPLHHFSISSEQILKDNAFVRDLKPPGPDEVRLLMSSRSIQDPVMYEQVYLALLIAADHLNPASPNSDYYNLLPHPAINDEEVIRRHKDVLDPLLLVEWDDYQKEMLSVLHQLLRRWGTQAPPIQVAYWALRTVFSRMHMLPKAGQAPQEVGSTLSYAALSTVDRAELQTRWWRRFRSTLSSLMGNPAAAERYHLVPTLVPLLDMAPHVSSSNVQVEVNTRDVKAGSCAELRAVRDIDAGESIGLRFNASQSPAFLLFRFGFIPQ
ncbi:putative mitochondrial hypothetical protein [Leptomonas pyrrhocoris]|uniref:Uncharacterized protein n=1 Tax=Leptomonas pyrrhocoris TaxID=157538 RepID=A0A0N0DS09_LEPPY|nr:putative mitochondrial hypothetical protein [Leptomonas pyrrhocoris]KPA75222.1 putative mitochondrial hypothetical protein [Leptomonas pyrrhocoris]|eukprot:XP_015653661.1 putative mitochondrial hypothetical protein [Leptomonas pyrrhocoris]